MLLADDVRPTCFIGSSTMERHEAPGSGQEAQEDDAEASGLQLVEDTTGDGDGAVASTGSRDGCFAFPAAASTDSDEPVRQPIPDTGYCQLIPDDGDQALIESVSNRVLVSAQGVIDLHDVFISWQQRLENHEIVKRFAKHLDKVVTDGACAKTWFAQKIIKAPRSYDVLANLANMIENGITETTAIMDGMKQHGILKKCLMPLKPVSVEEDEESSVEIDLEKLVMSKNPKSRGV
jgi:hypothetical protein